MEEGARRGGGVSVADTAAASGVLAEENAEMGRRLGWASARSGAARYFFKTFCRKIRRKINKNPKKIKTKFPRLVRIFRIG